jgi:dipeptidyl aminopeptidase/acylaminoacyl peptidase
MISMAGTSDFGFSMAREFGGPWWKKLDDYWRMSPLKYVTRIKTPLLIIHSENDQRTPIEQAEQLYIALKLQKKEVQFVRYPEESHGLSRMGRPDRRIHRLKKLLEWFDRYLKK